MWLSGLSMQCIRPWVPSTTKEVEVGDKWPLFEASIIILGEENSSFIFPEATQAQGCRAEQGWSSDAFFLCFILHLLGKGKVQGRCQRQPFL